MTDLKDFNVYDLVNEVNKNNDSVDSKLESLYNAIDNEAQISNHKHENLKDSDNTGYELHKPRLVKKVTSTSSRYDRFCEYISSIDYGTNNNPNYMKGHKDAVTKYNNIFFNNEKDGYVVMGTLTQELKEIESNKGYGLYDKGYYDGLMYVYEALTQSKKETLQYISNELKKELG